MKLYSKYIFSASYFGHCNEGAWPCKQVKEKEGNKIILTGKATEECFSIVVNREKFKKKKKNLRQIYYYAKIKRFESKMHI